MKRKINLTLLATFFYLLSLNNSQANFQEQLLDKYKTINFENNNTNNLPSNFSDDIVYLENIKSLDLFNLIKNASLVVSPHGTMTVMASYLKVPVLDIFDNTINKIAFYEYKPDNDNYKFMILRPFSERQLIKIERLLNND